MLVLTRKPHEKIQIGEHVTITVLKTKGKAVRLGIEAPADIAVLRGELVAPGAEPEAPESTTESTVLDAPIPGPTAKPGPSAGEVRFERSSRSRVKTLLPELLGDAGPLREMLARRGEAPVC